MNKNNLENYDPNYKVNVRFAPCKDCPNRYLGCHDKCYKYQAFRQARDEVLKKERENWTKSYYRDLTIPNNRDRKIK